MQNADRAAHPAWRVQDRRHAGLATGLRIEHPISHFQRWKTAFDSFAEARANAGVRNSGALRDRDQARHLAPKAADQVPMRSLDGEPA